MAHSLRLALPRITAPAYRLRVGVGVGVWVRSRSRARSRARARVRIRITAPACFSRVTSGASPSGLESSNASEPG